MYTLGLVFSMSLYLVMVFLQLMADCLVVILWASILVVHPMVASSLIHFYRCVTIQGVGDGCIFEYVDLLDIWVAWLACMW